MAHLSPLDAAHRTLGAKLVPFGGWEMPLHYAEGTLHEHRACRSCAVVFDVSHLGTVRVSGMGAFTALQRAFTNDLARIAPGRAQYTHLLDDRDGSVVDDIIVWWVDSDSFDVMPNASNTERVSDALAQLDDHTLDVADTTATRAVLAVQGPRARERLAAVSPEAAAVARFRVARVRWRSTTLTVAGTGYTGDDGVEIAVAIDHAAELFDQLLSSAIEPAGLGARDTLRLEAGLPLHGHELGPGITPLQANLAWVVAFDKGEFRGRGALVAERDRGVARRLRGLIAESRRPLRAELTVRAGGRELGVTTSGNFSPLLEKGIGLALLPSDVALGARVQIDVRGAAVDAVVVSPPFYKPAS